MPERDRGPLLTTFAVLFALMALSNFLKPLELGATTGFVFFGERMTGAWNLVLGPLFGIYLAVYAYGILRMKRFSVGMAHAYALYVILNLTAWSIRQENPNERGAVFAIAYVAIAVGVSMGSAIVLTRRKAELD
jgi:hypothetical protein